MNIIINYTKSYNMVPTKYFSLFHIEIIINNNIYKKRLIMFLAHIYDWIRISYNMYAIIYTAHTVLNPISWRRLHSCVLKYGCAKFSYFYFANYPHITQVISCICVSSLRSFSAAALAQLLSWLRTNEELWRQS